MVSLRPETQLQRSVSQRCGHALSLRHTPTAGFLEAPGGVDAWPRFPRDTLLSPSCLLRRTPMTKTKHKAAARPTTAAVSCSLSAPMRHKERSPRLPGSWTPGPGATDTRRRGTPGRCGHRLAGRRPARRERAARKGAYRVALLGSPGPPTPAGPPGEQRPPQQVPPVLARGARARPDLSPSRPSRTTRARRAQEDVLQAL